MQITRIIHVAALMLIVIFVSSCASSNQYVSKLFSPRPITVKDSQIVAIRFLELDDLEADKQAWVKTDITKIEDSTAQAKVTPLPLPEEPIAKTGNPDGTRTKRSRE